MDYPKKTYNLAFKLELKLYTVLKPFLIISQVFCVAPAGIHYFEPLQERWGIRILHGIHYVWCFVVYLCLSSSIYTEYTTFNTSLPTVQKPLYFSEYLVYLFHVPLIIVACNYRKSKFGRCIQTIVAVDCKLLAFGVIPYYGILRKFFILHLCFLGLYTASTAAVDFFYSGEEAISFLRSMTVYLVPNLIMGLSMSQYYALMHVIRLRFSSVVKSLQNFKSRYSTEISSESESWNAVNRLRDIISVLDAFTKEVNSTFAYSILMIYFGSFINISINIFLIYKYVDQKTEINIAWTMYSVTWVAMHIAKMFLILYYNQNILVEKDNIILELNDIHPYNEKLKTTLRRLLLQVMVDSRAHVLCGMVHLHMSFVRPILEHISVLVIFLIQYDVTFEALTNVHNTALTPAI